MNDFLKDVAKSYNGAATCGWSFDDSDRCGNVALWMPVLVGVAEGYEETDSSRIPVAILGVGTCEACKEKAGGDIVQEVMPQMIQSVNIRLQGCGRVPIRFDRLEWARIAEIN